MNVQNFQIVIDLNSMESVGITKNKLSFMREARGGNVQYIQALKCTFKKGTY